MRQFIFPSLIICLFLLNSCSRASKSHLTERASQINVMHEKPSPNCRVQGKYVGRNKQASLELAKNHARNLAAKDGANAIIFDEQVRNANEWKVYATGYQCN